MSKDKSELLKWKPHYLSHIPNCVAPKKMNFGGKGNGLLQLRTLRISVPETAFFDLNEIHKELCNHVIGYEDLVAEVFRWQNSPNVENRAQNSLQIIQEKILAWPMPSEWNDLGHEIAFSLGSNVIVRSSMSVEDQGGASFAGCFESLRVSSNQNQSFDIWLNELWSSIIRVLLSAFKPSSMIQLLSEGVSPQKFKVGFLIQKWIEPTIAGVCFSHSPSDPWSNTGCIEWGKDGEWVVQGRSSQGKWQTQYIKENETPPNELRPFWRELWKIKKRILTEDPHPIDLEWVWTAQKLWIVQLRPIATEEAKLVGRSQRWTRELTEERFPEPLTPMGWTALQDVFATNLKTLSEKFGIEVKRSDDAGICYGGFVYSDPELFRFPGGIRIRWSFYLAPWKKSFWNLLRVAFRFIKRTPIKPITKSLASLEAVNALIARDADHLISGWEEHRDSALKKINSYNQSLNGLENWDSSQVLSVMDNLKFLSIEFLEPDLSIYLMKDGIYRTLNSFWTEVNRSELPEVKNHGFSDLISCFNGNRTVEMNLELKDFISLLRSDPQKQNFLKSLELAETEAEAIQASKSLNPAIQKSWKKFLEENGHIRTSWDVALPSWKESPSQLAILLRLMLTQNQTSLDEISLAGNQRKRDESRKLFFEKIANAGLKPAIKMVEKSFFRLEKLMQIDEEQHFLSGKLLDPSRKLICRGEEILKEANLLQEKGSAFFLELNELKENLVSPQMNLQFLAEKRKAIWLRNKANPKPMHLPPQLNPKSQVQVPAHQHPMVMSEGNP